MSADDWTAPTGRQIAIGFGRLLLLIACTWVAVLVPLAIVCVAVSRSL